jgi:hypothetical protein
MKRKVVIIFIILLLGLVLAGSSLALARTQGVANTPRLGMVQNAPGTQALSTAPLEDPAMNWKRVSPYGFSLDD